MPFDAPTKSSVKRVRKVGQEMTKPKPGVKPKKEVKPPSYEQQNDEKGEQDTNEDVEDIVSEEEDEEIEQSEQSVKPAVIATKHGQARSVVSVRTKPKERQVTKAVTVAPHMSLIKLVADYKGKPGKPAKLTEYSPNMYQLFAMHEAVSSILTPLKAVHKDDPSYNSVYSRTALAFCVVFKLLKAREECGIITYDESKVLKRLRLGMDLDSTMIPAPYVMFLQTLGYHSPADKRFDVICPKLPTNILTYMNSDATNMMFPFIPGLNYLCHQIASGNVMKKEKGKSTGEDAFSDKLIFWQNGRIVIKNSSYKQETERSMWGTSVKDSINGLKYAALNCAMYYQFFDKDDNLKRVNDTAMVDAVPYALGKKIGDDSDSKADDLLNYFGIKDDVRWLSAIFEALEYEARFFSGSATLGSLGNETGQELLCVYKMKLTDKAFAAVKWYERGLTDAEGHDVYTSMEGVDDSSLSIMQITHTITVFGEDQATNPLNNGKSVPINTDTKKLTPYSDGVKRVISDVPSVKAQFRTHLKSEMLLKLKDVLSG